MQEVTDKAMRLSDEDNKNAMTQLDMANERNISSQDDLDRAGEQLRTVVTVKKAIEERRKLIKAPIVEAGKQVDRFFKAPLDNCYKAETIIKGKINKYLTDERIRREAEAKEAKIAEQKIADAKLKEACKEGDVTKILDTQAEIKEIAVTPVPVVSQPKTDGIHQRKTWSAKLISIDDLIISAADGDAKAYSLLSFNQAAANALARQLKGSIEMDGVEFIETTGVVNK